MQLNTIATQHPMAPKNDCLLLVGRVGKEGAEGDKQRRLDWMAKIVSNLHEADGKTLIW